MSQIMGGERDDFLAGVRVLAVDNDPVFLRLLEDLLRECKYHVTTSSEAVEALRMLKENEANFDLIIADVSKPGMDDFKLLETVGLEMDLPVIMVSANDDKEVVLKGIHHGACDFLLKPVRVEDVKNIWQHVTRKKISVPRENNHSDNVTLDAYQGAKTGGSSDGMSNKKSKDLGKEGGDGHKDTNETENASSKKKSRIVWHQELHDKFVDAVNQLGIDKAIPKEILELMNDERVSRECVATHLQKFRLYLRRLENQQDIPAASTTVQSNDPQHVPDTSGVSNSGSDNLLKAISSDEAGVGGG